ncbi:hypothetical protein MBANPS3_011296 [Mucor bainieri]
MIQIANTLLPPVIVNNGNQHDAVFQASERIENLIAPNSFYVQANVTETQISFILNKVIEVPSSEAGIDLFTVQERSVEIEDIAEASSCLLWNHYQLMLDMDEQQHTLFKRCQDHDTMVLSSSQCEEFSRNARMLIEAWFTTEDTFPGERLDTYRLISVDQQCSCALRLSQRLLLEVGLKSVVANIATTITSALFSDDYFGLYQPSALILEKNWKTIKNLPFLCAINGLLNQALEEYLHIHYNRLLLLFQDKCANSDISQYLGRGDYSQVSSMTYTFKLKLYPKKGAKLIFGFLEESGCTKLPLIPIGLKQGDSYSSFELTYPVLAEEEDLPLNGITLTFPTKECLHIDIEVWLSHDSKGGASQQQVGRMSFGAKYELAMFCSPISVKILPVHYSSAIKFVASISTESSHLVRPHHDTTHHDTPSFFFDDESLLQGACWDFDTEEDEAEENYTITFENEDSIIVQERLFLKK